MNTYLRKEKQKNVFEKYFSMLINDAAFGNNHRKLEETQRYETCNK